MYRMPLNSQSSCFRYRTRIQFSRSPSDLALRKYIPKHIINYVRRGQNIPLDAFNVSHLKLLSSPYDVRGTSVIVSVYKDLMLYDKLRESKFAQADGMVNPLTLVTLGGEGDYREKKGRGASATSALPQDEKETEVTR